jgi:hypothetical protein
MDYNKKPDNVVFNHEEQKYDASLKPYATSLSAPVITTTDTVAWKNRSIHKLNHKLEAKFEEIKDAYQNMMNEYEYNKLIFDSSFSFEPILGEIYHLYKKNANKTFLSLIAPEQCKFDFIGSFRLNADQIWEKVM